MSVNTRICLARSIGGRIPMLRLKYDNRFQVVVVNIPVEGLPPFVLVGAIEYAEAYRHLYHKKVQWLSCE